MNFQQRDNIRTEEMNVIELNFWHSAKHLQCEIDASYFRNNDHSYVDPPGGEWFRGKPKISANPTMVVRFLSAAVVDTVKAGRKAAQRRGTTAIPFIYNRRCRSRAGRGRATVYGGILSSLINDRPRLRWRQSDSSLPRRTPLCARASQGIPRVLAERGGFFDRRRKKDRRKRVAIAL